MHGAVFGVLIVIVAISVFAGWPAIVLVPLVIAALAFLTVWLLGVLRDSGKAVPEPGPGGVPTTREASYDPVEQP